MCHEQNTPHLSEKDIYLEKDRFLDICKKINVKVTDCILEAYEKYELIYPIYRIIRPREYIQALFEQNQEQNPKDNTAVFDQYSELYKFESKEIPRWNIQLVPRYNEDHPLDQAFKRNAPFIKKPSKDNFQKWEEYKIRVEITTHKQILGQTTSIAAIYYSPWQIYLLEEANRKHTKEINVLSCDVSNFRGQNYPRKLENAKYIVYFETLWKFKFHKYLLFNNYFDKTDNNIIEGDNYKDLQKELKKIANNFSILHPYNEWIKFLQHCCSLFFEYQKNEQISLSQCIKDDIGSLIDLLLYGESKKYTQLIEDVGMYIGHASYMDVPPLERIFPEYENHIKRESKPSLESVLKNYNEETPSKFHLNKEDIDEIINYAFKNGNETLLISIVGLKNVYFSSSYFRNESLWTHIRSLAVSVESWMKLQTGIPDFYNSLVHLTSGDFVFGYTELLKYCKKESSKISNISDFKNCLSNLTMVDLIKNGKDLCWMKFLIRSYLIRNYIVHHTKVDPDLFGNTLIEFYRSLLFLVFFSWKVHSEKNSC